MSCKINYFLLIVLSLNVFSDWESDVSYIRNYTEESRNELTIIRPKVDSIMYYTEDIRDDISDFHRMYLNYNSLKGSNTRNLYMLESLYGVDFVKDTGTENVYAYKPNIPNGYKYQFGLRDTTKDDSQYLLDYINSSMKDMNTDEKFDMDKWDRGVYQSADYPTSFLKARSKGNWIVTANNETSYGIGQTQSQYLTSTANGLLGDVSNKVEPIRQRIINTTSSGNYTGIIFSMNFHWLRAFMKKMSNDLIDVESLSTTQWSVSLVPQYGDWLYPIWTQWNSLRYYVDVIITFACYGFVILFYYEKISDILTK